MTGPVDVLAVMDAYSVPGQICCGMPVGGGCDENGNGEAPSCCGQPLTERDMQEARAAVAELIRCGDGLLLSLDLKHPAVVVNNWRKSLRAALARVGGAR